MKVRVRVTAPLLLMASVAFVVATGTASSAALAPARSTPLPTCQTSQLLVGLKLSGHAAGTTYYAIVFSRHGATRCALRGYPGVSFVAPVTGHQVGAAASRNARNSVRTVAVGNGSAASALLGIANHALFGTRCNSRPVSGLRVYPPGGATAVYLPFRHLAAACSTMVGQLNVAAVVPGTSAL